jgi:hypothetical protein
MSKKNYIRSIPMTVLPIAALPIGWNAINPNGLPYPCSIVRIVNRSKSDLAISLDGINAHDVVLQDSTATLLLEQNALPILKTCRMHAKKKVYVMGAASAGFVYLIGYY